MAHTPATLKQARVPSLERHGLSPPRHLFRSTPLGAGSPSRFSLCHRGWVKACGLYDMGDGHLALEQGERLEGQKEKEVRVKTM